MAPMGPFQVRLFYDSLKSKDTGFINTTQVFKQSKVQKTWVQILASNSHSEICLSPATRFLYNPQRHLIFVQTHNQCLNISRQRDLHYKDLHFNAYLKSQPFHMFSQIKFKPFFKLNSFYSLEYQKNCQSKNVHKIDMKFSQVFSNPKNRKITQLLGTPLPCRERDCAPNHDRSEQTKK